MIESELVVNRAEFSRLSDECEGIINTQKRFPNFVFRRPFLRYFVIEHAYVFGERFGAFLFNMSKQFGDESVHYMTIEPDPVDYYFRYCSFFGLASFKSDTLMKRYVPVMIRDGNVNSFRSRGGDVSVFWGSSLRWGVSCDRVSWEIAVVAVMQNVDVPKLSGLRCLDATSLSNYIKSQYSQDRSIPSDFAQRFLANYPI